MEPRRAGAVNTPESGRTCEKSGTAHFCPKARSVRGEARSPRAVSNMTLSPIFRPIHSGPQRLHSHRCQIPGQQNMLAGYASALIGTAG
jgi:hypothetical protein